ncbi:intraflagellar transport protein 88 homolog [Hetaerina americana]|uniref:intraflagellar transport protein 88 homolog n=1 Tax=Hetaerina americana TaxID=62018 RepID=UPI003A7F3C34
MDRSFLNPVDEDDLYSGFNEYPSVFSTNDLQEDEEFQEAVRTSYEKRPTLLSRPGIATRLGTPTGYRQGTSMVSSQGFSRLHSRGNEGGARPMTAVHGAGYTSNVSMFDPLNHGTKGLSSTDVKNEDSPQVRVKQLEKQIRVLLDESCVAKCHGKLKIALEKAKDACKKERNMVRLQEQAGLVNSRNEDLSFSTLFNLANQYEANEMYSEALSTYQSITRNRMLPNVKRLLVNMGNIYLKMGQYPKAVKLYQMALDHVPEMYKNLRIKITHNIGLLYVKMGQYQDACTSFEYIMQEKPDFKTGLHLVLCNYALGDPDSMKKAFLLMLEVTLDIEDDDKYSANSEDAGANLLLEAIRTDGLRAVERKIKQEAEHCILMAARVVAPAIAPTPSEGYDWCVQALRTVAPQHNLSGNLSSMVSSFHSTLADELEVHKAVVQLKGEGGNLQASVSTLQAFAKRGDSGRVSSIACTNLAFIHFLQGDIEQAEKCADIARQADSYNASALVNLGNCAFAKGDVERAKKLYICSLESNASCVEALYNLGLSHKHQGNHEDALDCFLKLNAIVKHHPEVLYMLAHLHELLGDKDQANEWYLLLLGIVPSDPGILQKVGQIYEAEGDRQLAHQYHTDSNRYYPSNLDVIEWLGSYYISMQLPEKALTFFERAALLCPEQIKWHLMVASCHRRCGNYQQALQLYRNIHQQFPENTDCLRFLVRLCSDLGLKEAMEYALELKKAEKSKDVRERIGSSRPGSWRSSGRPSRVGTAIGDGDSSNHHGNSAMPPSRHEQPSNSPSLTGSSDVSRPQSSVERARTSGTRNQPEDDDFGDEELGDDLLPE